MRAWRSSLLLIVLLLAACAPAPAAVPTAAVPPTAAPASPVPTVAAPTSVPATDTPMSTPTPPGFDKLVTAAQQEGQLNVIALPHEWMNYGAIIATFAQKYGIQVKEMDPGAGSAAELNAIKTGKNDPTVSPDVIDVGLPFALQAKQLDLLAPYKVSTWDSIPEAAKDGDGYWYGDYYGLIVFEVNPAFVPTLPQDWPDLLNADYNIAIGGYPAQSYLGMMAVYSASVANGGSLDNTLPGLRYFQKINRSGHLSPNFTFTANSVASGEPPLELTWDYLALADQRASGNVTVVVPKTGLIAGLYAQAISAYAPHPNAAKLWMEFLYSDEGQLLFLNGLGHPARFADLYSRGVIPADVLANLLPSDLYLQAVFPTTEQLSAADRSIIASWRDYVK